MNKSGSGSFARKMAKNTFFKSTTEIHTSKDNKQMKVSKFYNPDVFGKIKMDQSISNNIRMEESLAKYSEKILDPENCVVCFDEKPDCIFQPCGHSGIFL